MTQTPDGERRDSFRVNMTAMVAIQLLNKDTIAPSDCFPELHAMALLSESTNIDQEISQVSERIKDLAVKRTISLLRKKLTLLEKLIDLKAAQNSDLNTQNIDISEGGCSIYIDGDFQIDQRIALALIFTPSYFALFAFAKISNITKKDSEQIVHLCFDPLSEPQRQELLKYMFKAQTSHTII